MSAKASGRVWDLDLPHNKRLVLLAMVDHADHEGRNIYPSTDLIAWKTGYSFRQVQRVIDALVSDGVLIVVRQARQQHPTTYSLNFSAGVVKPPFDRVARKAQSRQNVTPQNGQNVTSEDRQNVTSEQSRDDISAHPGMTFEHARDDIAMSSKPWNQHEPTTPTANDAQKNGVVVDDLFRELRRRGVGRSKARQIASMGGDAAVILSAIDHRANPDDLNTLGGVINDIIDGVVSDRVLPTPNERAPLQTSRPNLPETAVPVSEILKLARQRNGTS